MRVCLLKPAVKGGPVAFGACENQDQGEWSSGTCSTSIDLKECNRASRSKIASSCGRVTLNREFLDISTFDLRSKAGVFSGRRIVNRSRGRD